ncbi:MAG: holo-ACP synthase [Clostridiales bacterium]|nr:holo-ACP synthase [Clostridiales bacterium]
MLLTGIDLVEIPRIENSLKRESFLKRVMGREELEEYRLSGSKAQRVAACFAAKEAFGKSLGTGLNAFSLTEVQLLHEDSGKPYFFLTGKAKKLIEKNKIELSVSITHTDKYAAAVVVGYSPNERLCLK